MTNESKLEQIRKMVYSCVQCGYCREKYSDEVFTTLIAYRVCPIREHTAGFEHHCARGKIKIAQGILEGRFDYTDELINLLYTDPDCKLCSWICHAEPMLDPVRIWLAMRQDIVAAGLGPPEPLKQIDNRVSQKHNVFGAIQERRARWAADLDLPRNGDTVYFAGCHASYPKSEIARSTVAILRKAGIDVAYLGEDEWCCGVVQFHDGSIDIAEELARHNVESISNSGARRVVTGCAECYKSLKLEYPALVGELPFEVVHTSELFAELIDSGKLELKEGLDERKITYHDPCQMGRYCQVYDPPREILKRIPGIELIEMLRHHGNAWCCGNGADMVRSMDGDLAREIAMDRLTEANEAGAEAIVTACPRCVESFERVAEGMKVYDLSVVTARALSIGT
ncbi:MAG: (Fe-S)-binding protein [Dehalococcoidia bacterium]